jgi:hypothetical protein
MRTAVLGSLALLVGSPGSCLADDAADISGARKFVQPVLASSCDLQTNDDGTAGGENFVYQIKYRTRWQDQDSPDETLTLVQLHCFSAAYNFSSIYVTRQKDGKWSLLSFAQPKLDFDYADEDFSTLKAPPKVAGYISQHELMNSEYSAETRTISATAKWRGMGDAWSAGEWKFEEGVFVLTRYEVDPTFEPPDGEDNDPAAPESYVVFEAHAAPK